jgi:hypothetical protein
VEAASVTSFIAHTAVDCHSAYDLSEWWKQLLGYVDPADDPNLPAEIRPADAANAYAARIAAG